MPQILEEKIIPCEWTGWCRENCMNRRIRQEVIKYEDDTVGIFERGIPEDCLSFSSRKLNE